MLLLSIPIGIAVDRGNRVRLLIGLASVWTVGTLLTAIAPSVPRCSSPGCWPAIGTTGALTAALSLTADCARRPSAAAATLVVTFGKSSGIGGRLRAGRLAFRPVHRRAGPRLFGAIAALARHPLCARDHRRRRSSCRSSPREPARHEVVAGTARALPDRVRRTLGRRAFPDPLVRRPGQRGHGRRRRATSGRRRSCRAATACSREEFAGWMGLLIFGAGISARSSGGFAPISVTRAAAAAASCSARSIAAGVGIPAALFPISPDVPIFAVASGC